MSAASEAIPPELPGLVSAKAERLILAERVRAVFDLKKVPRLPPGQARMRLVGALVDLYARQLPRSQPGDRRFLLEALAFALHVACGRPQGVRLQHGVARGAGDNSARLRRIIADDVDGYAISSAKEATALRVALLLRMLGRRAAAIHVLLRRLRAYPSSTRSSQLLAELLREGGEEHAAGELERQRADGADPRPRPLKHVPGRLRYAVVVITMFDSDVFRTSVRSLLESDFTGTVVVAEDGNEDADQCRAFCDEVGVAYVKAAAWIGCTATLDLGLRRVASDADIVLYSHNDVLWPSRWLGDLDRAWELVWDSDRVSLLNLGYLQFRKKLDPALYRMFLAREYDDLLWMLRALREIPTSRDQIQAVEVGPGEDPFGLAREAWVDSIADLRQMTGRLSVAASFPVHVWREMGGFNPDLVYAMDLQMLHHNLVKRRFSLFLNCLPLIHLKSTDTSAVAPERVAELGDRFMRQTYDGFERKYGWHIEHFLNLYFGESTVIHRDALTAAVNALRFDDAEFLFDDFARRLKQRTLENCELTWCRTRASCPYEGVSQ